jgi:hypothetical protein
METYTDGAFVFYRVSRGMADQAHDPETVRATAASYGLPPHVVPDYAGDRAAVARAISRITSGLSRQGWQLTSIKTARHDVVYGISAIQRDREAERVDFTFNDRLRWTDEHGNGHRVEGGHDIARRVDAEYQKLRGKIIAPDWTAAITDYLLSTCQAVSMRDDGRIYWAPPQHQDKIATFSQLLQSVNISLVRCAIEAEHKTVVHQAAADSLYDKITELEQDAEAFDGSQNAATYKRRLEMYSELRKRATTYREALGIGVDKAQSVLDRLEAEVSTMLNIRQGTVIPRHDSIGALFAKPQRIDNESTAAFTFEPHTRPGAVPGHRENTTCNKQI